MNLTRRTFLAGTAAWAVAGSASAAPRRKRVLLRSSWQTVNIGDIAHTPGMLRLLEEHLPEVDVTLWPNALSDDVQSLLLRRFPKLKIARTAHERKEAMEGCDFFLHGSGPGLVGVKEAKAWQATGKPYGFGGVTLNDGELRDHRELLSKARFVYCRDTLSLEALKAARLDAPVQDFGPDATFAVDLKDDAKADAYLKEAGLEAGRFACFVPRLRWTPYWKEGRKTPPDVIESKHAENEKYKEEDHSKLRTVIAAWVSKTGLKALLCPEMTYQVELLKPLLFDPLPADVKAGVVVRPGYWLTDEAISTYRKAAVVVSLEMHSPILAIAGGRPAIHLRQPTDTRKGQMWRDVGLKDWLFEIGDATGEQIAERLLALQQDPAGTAALVAKARDFALAKDKAMMMSVAAAL